MHRSLFNCHPSDQRYPRHAIKQARACTRHEWYRFHGFGWLLFSELCESDMLRIPVPVFVSQGGFFGRNTKRPGYDDRSAFGLDIRSFWNDDLVFFFFQKMTTYTTTMLMAVIAVLVVSTCDCRINNLPTRCMPGLLEDAPPKVREACLTLSTIRTLSNAIETFIQDKQYPVSMPCKWSRATFRLSVNPAPFRVLGRRTLESTIRFRGSRDSFVCSVQYKPPPSQKRLFL